MKSNIARSKEHHRLITVEVVLGTTNWRPVTPRTRRDAQRTENPACDVDFSLGRLERSVNNTFCT